MSLALEGEDRLPRALFHEPGAGVGHIGLADAAAGPRIAWNRNETRCLVLEGEIYDLAPLEQSLVSHPPSPPPASQAELLLRLYEQSGVEMFSKLNGAFALAIWDRRERQLVLANDRLGLCPVYYARANDDLLFASGVRALLPDAGLNRTVDFVALNQFLVYDHVLDDVLLEAVRLLPQGSVLTFRVGHVAIRWTGRSATQRSTSCSRRRPTSSSSSTVCGRPSRGGGRIPALPRCSSAVAWTRVFCSGCCAATETRSRH